MFSSCWAVFTKLGNVIAIFDFQWAVKLLFHFVLCTCIFIGFGSYTFCISTARNGMVAFSYFIIALATSDC